MTDNLANGRKQFLVKNFFSKGKMRTTEARAKEIRSIIEKMITKAKAGKIRLLSSSLSDSLAKKLVNDIAPAFLERKGGYTRIVKLGQRTTDGASMVIIELVK